MKPLCAKTVRLDRYGLWRSVLKRKQCNQKPSDNILGRNYPSVGYFVENSHICDSFLLSKWEVFHFQDKHIRTRIIEAKKNNQIYSKQKGETVQSNIVGYYPRLKLPFCGICLGPQQGFDIIGRQIDNTCKIL